MKIRSFGCSFLAGDDLSDSNKTWPARIAGMLGLEHANHAQGASGNFRILHNILGHSQPGDFCFVNWTYVDRFDYRCWQDEIYNTLMPGDNDQLSQIYFKSIYGQYHQTLGALICAKTAIDFLTQINARYIMTYMDHSMFAPIDNNYENPQPFNYLQTTIRKHCRTWKGKNFLEWAQANRFPISDLSHPLDTAHQEAANFFITLTEWLLDGLPATGWDPDSSTWQSWKPKHGKGFHNLPYK